MGDCTMSRWGKPTKNKRKIDPRYFLKEQVENPLANWRAAAENMAQDATDWMGDTALDITRKSSYNQDLPGSSQSTWLGALRNFAETGLEHGFANTPVLKDLGGLTDAGNVLQHSRRAIRDRDPSAIDDAARTAAGGLGDVYGGFKGAKLGYAACGGPANPFAIGCGLIGAGIGSGAGEYVTKKAYDTAKAGAEAVYGTAKAGAEAVGTAHNRYQDRGVGQTLKDFGSELGDWTGWWEEGVQADNDMLLSESQTRRMQKLSGIAPAPRRRAIMKEALDPDTVGIIMVNAAALIYFLTLKEMSARHPDSPWYRPEGGPLSSIGRGVKSAWQKLKSVASSKAQQGDTSLESVVSTLEAAGPKAAQSTGLSEEDIAKIQSEFADDQQLAAMIASLGQASPEEYQQILSQIVEYIGSKSQ